LDTTDSASSGGVPAGALVALATPMTEAGDVDEGSFDRLLDYQQLGGVDGVVVGGTTGESATLSAQELSGLIRRARDRLPGHMLVLAGSGTNSTAASVVLTRQVFDAGADACMVVTPYYNRPTQAGLVAHFEAVADAAAGPVVLYNVPGRTACDMLPGTVETLSAHPRIAAVKEAVPDMARLREHRRRCGSGFAVLSGDDGTLADALEAGADGAITVTGNLAPRQIAELVSAGRRGDSARMRELDGALRDLYAALFVESNPIPLKWALTRLGISATAAARLPLTRLAPAYEAAVESAMRAAMLL
jgi:4-hydroxy-tetrahydrodipicolinate synthase